MRAGIPIRRLSNGRFEARPFIKGVQLSKTFEDLESAENWVMRQRLAARTGEYVAPDSTTLAQWVDEWLSMQSGYKPSTMRDLRGRLRRAVEIIGERVRLQDLRKSHVKRVLSQMEASGVGPDHRRAVLYALSGCLADAVSDRLLARNPCADVDPPRSQDREMLFLTPAEVARLDGALGDEHGYGLLAAFVAQVGTRWSEAAGLTVARLDLLRGQVAVVRQADPTDPYALIDLKGYAERHLPLTDALTERLREHVAGKRPSERVWTSVKGYPLREGVFRGDVWRPAVAAARLDPSLRFHDLRHTCASWLVTGGMDPYLVQRWLGHRSITTTERYFHALPKRLEDARAAIEAMHERTAEIGDGPATIAKVVDL